MKQRLRIIPQDGSYKDNENDYSGMTGEIEICNDCCRGKYRIQFLEIGNNEALENFDLSKCEFFLTSTDHG